MEGQNINALRYLWSICGLFQLVGSPCEQNVWYLSWFLSKYKLLCDSSHALLGAYAWWIDNIIFINRFRIFSWNKLILYKGRVWSWFSSFFLTSFFLFIVLYITFRRFFEKKKIKLQIECFWHFLVTRDKGVFILIKCVCLGLFPLIIVVLSDGYWLHIAVIWTLCYPYHELH